MDDEFLTKEEVVKKYPKFFPSIKSLEWYLSNNCKKDKRLPKYSFGRGKYCLIKIKDIEEWIEKHRVT